MADGSRDPVGDDLQAAIAGLRIGDLLAQTLVSVVSLGFAKLESGTGRDVEQARLAIEAVRALTPILEAGKADEALLRDLDAARASLQLAYASAVDEDRAGDEQPG